jgi:DNA polymerase-1
VAASLAQEETMLAVYRMGTVCKAENGLPCDRYTWCECKDCGTTARPIELPDGKHCVKCTSIKLEHQARCAHVDLHQRTAEMVGCKRNPLAKNLNFGTLYRMAAPKFCIYANLFDADGNPMVSYAASILAAWHSAYPGIAAFHQFVEETLPRNGWVAISIAGRRRRLDREAQINPYRAVTQGIQFKVSASSQDLIQIAMKRNMEERDRRARNGAEAERKLWAKWKPLIQVHDELIYQCPREIAHSAAQIFKHNMETADAGTLGVPLVCEPKIGRTWDCIH